MKRKNIDEVLQKEIAIDILMEIDRICKLHSLTYSLAFGTMLGAVRHEGFIPWDDDIDIMMPINDYRKLVKIFNVECEEKYFLQNKDTDKDCWLPFAKVRRLDTLFDEISISERLDFIKGIFVDIFPIYYLKNEDKYSAKKMYYYKVMSGVVCLKKKLNVNYGKKAKVLSKLLPFSNITILNILDKMYQSEATDTLIVPTDGNHKVKEIFVIKAEDFYPIKECKFEGQTTCIANNTDKILTNIYGNYMQLPPEEQRITNHLYKEMRFLNDDEYIENLKKAGKNINKI